MGQFWVDMRRANENKESYEKEVQGYLDAKQDIIDKQRKEIEKYRNENKKLKRQLDISESNYTHTNDDISPEAKKLVNEVMGTFKKKEKLEIKLWDTKKMYNRFINCTSTKPYEKRKVELFYRDRLNPKVFTTVDIGNRPTASKPKFKQYASMSPSELLDLKKRYKSQMYDINKEIAKFEKHIDMIKFAIAKRGNFDPDVLYDRYVNSSQSSWAYYLENGSLRNDQGFFKQVFLNRNPIGDKDYYEGWREDFDRYLARL